MIILDILYQIFIAPIELVMKLVLEQSFALTYSYGVSLIILSIVVNIALLPLYNLAEKWQQEERDKHNKIKDKIKEIKEIFKGQERFMMLQTLYRQNGYHPLLAARNSVGFLIQIPFFFAAFHLLSNYEALNGHSFLFFADLGKADALINIGSLSINAMPFVMTAINLLSAYFYTTQLAKKDKIQLYAISAVFLVALYTSPVALVFYWTMNNLFSMVKNVVQKSGIFVLNAKPKKEPLSIASISTKNYTILFALFLGAIFSIYYIKANIQPQFSMNIFWYLALFIIGAILALPSFLLGKSFGKKLKIALYIFIALIFALFVTKLTKFENRPEQLYYFVHLLVLISSVVFLIKSKFWQQSRAITHTPQSHLLALKVFVALFGLIFLVNGSILIGADDSYAISSYDFMSQNISYFVLSTALLFALYHYSSKRLKNLLFAISLYLLAVFAFYSFVLPISYGDMDNFVFNSPEALTVSKTAKNIEIALLLVLFFVTFFIASRYKKALNLATNATLTILAVAFVVYFPADYDSVSKSKPQLLSVDVFASDYQKERETTLAFSKNQNILVVVLDGFSGGNFEDIVENYPDISTGLDGFIWYKNTLSTGTSTAASFIAMQGGHNYTIEAINSRASKTIEEEAKEAYSILPNRLFDLGWSTYYTGIQYFDSKNIDRKKVDLINFDYGKYHLSKYSEYQELQRANFYKMINKEIDTINMISLFRASPRFLHTKIYKNGTWRVSSGEGKILKAINTKSYAWGLLDSFAKDSTFDNPKNSFKYIWLDIPHLPNAVGEDGQLTGVSNAYTESKETIHKLIEIFDLLKSADIYDNTKIIVASDHGLRYQKHTSFEAGFSSQIKSGYESKMQPSVMHPLLLIKEPKRRGKLEISTRLMSNADLPAIICSSLENGCDIKDIDPTKTKLDRTLQISTIVRDDFKTKNSFDITDAYRVKDNIFEVKNYEKIH